jgi:hypothetical protein
MSQRSASDSTPHDQTLRRLRRFAEWTDSAFRIPFTQYRIGLDALVGLLPAVGDAAGLLLGLVVPATAWRMGVPGPLIGRMLMNVTIDALLGVVPVIGDAFDVAWHANARNVALLEAHVGASVGSDESGHDDR